LIGIYGGTFDPIHYGHLRMALFVQQRLRLQRLHMIPCAQPVRRAGPHASAEQRFKMLQLALLPFPALVPDRTEIDRDGPSYTIDTLKEFRQRYAARVCLVVGYDAFCGFSTWHQWQQIPQYAHIVVLRRDQHSGIEAADFPQPLHQLVSEHSVDESEVPAKLSQSDQGCVVFLKNPKFFESASAIREALRHETVIRHRIPLAVADYIDRYRLYR